MLDKIGIQHGRLPSRTVWIVIPNLFRDLLLRKEPYLRKEMGSIQLLDLYKRLITVAGVYDGMIRKLEYLIQRLFKLFLVAVGEIKSADSSREQGISRKNAPVLLKVVTRSSRRMSGCFQYSKRESGNGKPSLGYRLHHGRLYDMRLVSEEMLGGLAKAIDEEMIILVYV